MSTPDLITYELKLELARTAEYSEDHGGSTVDVCTSMVTVINRVNEIHRIDLGFQLQLVSYESLMW